MDYLKSILTFISKKEVYGLAIIILISLLAYYFGRRIIEKIVNYGKSEFEKKRRHTIVKMISNILKYAIYILAIFFVLDLYGVNTKALVASLGVAGAILGLAFQDMIKDFISGITIIMDNYFVVGDIITINDFTGEVIELGLRTTKIKKVNGEVLVIANHNIDNVVNISQKKANVIIEIPTSYEDKTSSVEKTITKILNEINKLNGVLNTKYLGISSLADSAVNYMISIECKSELQWQIKRDSLKIIKNAYDKDKIKIPYQQIEVHHETV